MPRRLPLLLLLISLAGCLPAPEARRDSTKPTVPASDAAPVARVDTEITPQQRRAALIAARPPLPPLAASRPANLPPPALPDIPVQLPTGFVVVPAGFSQLRPPSPPSLPTAQSAPLQHDADLGNVVFTMLLSDAQRGALAANGFVVTPSSHREFYEVYEDARYRFQPVMVTSDAVLHSYHLAFSSVLRQTEQQSLAPLLARLDWQLLYMSLQYSESLAGTPFGEAARRNAAYFAVPVALLTPGWQPPSTIADLVNADLQRILAAGSSDVSAITGRPEDWTQYTVRGHYTKSETLGRYFQAMMWHGRATLQLAGGAGNPADDLALRQMLLMTHALRYAQVNGVPAVGIWQTLDEVQNFMVGESADLTPPELFPLLEQAYGAVGDVRMLEDASRIAYFAEGVRLLTPEGDVPQLRLLGQRTVPDTDVMTALLEPQVPGRTLPRGLDVLAALGSARAVEHLQAAGETGYPNYPTQLAAQQQRLAGWTDEAWGRTSYRGVLAALQPLLSSPEAGVPLFMQSPAWLDKQLIAALGGWTQLRHDTRLAASPPPPPGAEAGYGAWLNPPSPEPPPAYVEPVPQFYARINAVATQLHEGLKQRGLLPTYCLDPCTAPFQSHFGELAVSSLRDVIDLTARLQQIAEKQLSGALLPPEDHEYLRSSGVVLERIAHAARRDITNEFDVTLVSDVASDSSGAVLHQALGPLDEIYVIAPIDGRLMVARGAVFSHYEFSVSGARLTNDQWRDVVAAGQLPPRAPWTASNLVTERVDDALATRVTDFSDELILAFFFVEAQGSYSYVAPEGLTGRDYSLYTHLTGTELDDTLRVIVDLQQRRQMVEMKRIALEFVSFQLSGDSAASVTTREMWDERLYPLTAEDTAELPPPIGRRSYTVEGTYTLVRQNGTWLISDIVFSPEPPGWSTP